MEHLARSGVRRIVANTHPMAELVEGTLAAFCPEGVSVGFSRETTLLGTGGGLRRARPYFDEPTAPVIVMNGDTLFAPALGPALEAHRRRGAVATMILRHTPDPERFGAIGIDSDERVTTLLGTPEGRPVTETLMFTGVHILSPEAFDAMPDSGCVIRSAYRRWVDEGSLVLGIVDDSPWADLGTVSEYHRLNVALASGEATWPGVETINGCIVADDVDRHATFRNSVVGAGARIDPNVALDRCVVWPGTRVAESIQNAVLTPAHRIVVDG
jgi:NDP-sugar pyrophosphorylase family protein